MIDRGNDGEREGLLQFALEVAGLGYWELDTATEKAFRSPRHDQIFGYDAPLPEWTYPQFLAHVHEEDRERVGTLYSHALETGQDWRFQCRIHRASDGQVRWIEAHGRHFRDAGGLTIRIIGTVADISERERLLGEQKRLVAELQEASVRQRRFLREMLLGFTEGRLRLCESRADLPRPLPPFSDPIQLTRATIRNLRKQVVADAEELQLPLERRQDFETAVGEAAMNAVQHGGGGKGRVHGNPDSGVVQIWIEDQGEGIAEDFIHRAIEQGWTTGGFAQGFFLMRTCADRIYLLTGPTGTTVVLEQERTPPQPAWLK